MKGSAIFITSLFVTMSVSAQTKVETDSIDTSVFDKYLDEIVIVAKKPGTIAKTDRKVYTVNQDLMSKASSASEVLNHIPSVEVDIDGNVSMRGNDNVTILINGKPSAISVTDLLDTYKLSYTLDTPALKQKVEKRRNPRIIYVGLSWNFGGGGRKQHHNVEYDEEM